jgi:hypothetical protein
MLRDTTPSPPCPRVRPLLDVAVQTERFQHSQGFAKLHRRLARLQLDHEPDTDTGCRRQLRLRFPSGKSVGKKRQQMTLLERIEG